MDFLYQELFMFLGMEIKVILLVKVMTDIQQPVP